jgi:hypothetical protein
MFPLSDLSILFMALLIIAMLSVGLLILLGICLHQRSCSSADHGPQITDDTANYEVKTDEETTLVDITRMLERYHEEDITRARRERDETISYVTWGFALASTGLAIARVNPLATIASTVVALAFFVIGTVLNVRSRR